MAGHTPEVDVHSFVLMALEQHLAVMLEVRTRLTAARATLPGTRLRLVAEAAASARRYLDRAETLLSGPLAEVSPLR